MNIKKVTLYKLFYKKCGFIQGEDRNPGNMMCVYVFVIH